MSRKNSWWDNLTEDEKVMEIICDCYSNMSDLEDGQAWSLDEAKLLVDDLIEDDIRNGRKPLAYDVEDVYDTIHHLFMQDYDELDTEHLYH